MKKRGLLIATRAVMNRVGFLVLWFAACVATDDDPSLERGGIGGGGKADGTGCPDDPAGAIELASAQVWPGSLVVDDARVDWATAGDSATAGAVWSTSRCADGTPELIADAQRVPADVAVDAANVYWVTYDAGSSHGTVMKRAKSGGSAVALATGEHGPIALALRGSDVYYVTLDALKLVGANAASPAVTLAPTSCAHDGLAIDGSHVYWTEDCVMFGTPRIARWSSSGVQTVLRGDHVPQNFAADATHLYWTHWTPNGLRVERVAKQCGWLCSSEAIATADGYAGPVAVDA